MFALWCAYEVYRTDSDKIGNFIKECLAKTGKNSSIKSIYEVYSTWCSDNGYGTESKGNFISEIKSKGLYATSGTVEGKTVRNIVKGYTAESDFMEVNGQEPIPFT